MKKLLSMLLAALLLAPLCAALPAAAANEVNIVVESIGEVARGTESVQLAVRISASPSWSALQAIVEFNSSALCFTGFELNPELSRQISEGEMCIFGVNDENAADGSVSFGYASAYDAGGGEGYYPGEYDYFGTLTFNALRGAPLGFTGVRIAVTELTRNEDDVPVAVGYTVTDGGVTLICAHDWQPAETVPASCEADGYVRYVCAECGDEYNEVESAIGHDWGEWTESKPASCSDFGVEIRFCNNDHEHYQARQIAALGHDWGEWEVTVPATCAAAGTETRVCKRDALHTETRELAVDPEAHAWGEWSETSAATCTEAAVETRVCANDAAHTETREGKAALGHDFGEWTVTADPACTEAGEETRYCSRCDAFETREVAALGHDWGEWEVTIPATCAAAGTETRVCRRDASHIETRELAVDPEAHAWGEWSETSAATCTEAAVETRVCANDAAHTETREGKAALGHAWGEWEVTTPATCAAAGTETRVCARDVSHIETRELAIDPEAHAWGEWETASEPNCVHGKIETRVCANDASHTESRETGEPVPDAHDWGEWEVTKPASVFEDGEETRVCKNDPSHIETRVIPKPEYVVCDVDFDGEFTVSDALRALRIAAKLDAADELVRAAADADLDGEITVSDALAILRKALGLISE